MNGLSSSPVDRLRQWDERRPSLPGEHWITAAVGLYLLLRPARSVSGRLLSAGAGTLLLSRALSGRDGLITALKTFSEQASSEQPEYIDVAAPYPYDQRVRISTPRRVRPGAKTTTDNVSEGAPVSEPA